MTQIGVGIGVSKSPIEISLDKQNITKNMNHISANIHQQKILHKQFSNTSSEPRHTNDGVGDDENSNSFESHSDVDLNNKKEKKLSKISHNNRRGMSVNWGSNSTTAVNLTSTRSQLNCGQINPKNVKSFAQSLYCNPIRLSVLSAPKIKQPIVSTQPSMTLTPIPSEPELGLCRVYPPPQPRPESLAIMSEELFHEKLKARQSPIIINNHLSVSINLDKTPTEDSSHSDQTLTNEKQEENIIEINSSISSTPIPQLQLPIEQNINNTNESSDDSWRLLNSNTSLDIPYIDETDFEDLGKLFFNM
jgi:hypothetical protein